MSKNKILDLVKLEQKRQRDTLMMIPSENYTYSEVRSVVGSVLMHKYAEGQPRARYYQGMGVVDDIEMLCESEALKTFGLSAKEWHVNVQPYSGTPANLAVFNTFLNPGDRVMSMFLPDGGHLSHGWEYNGKKITLTSKIYNISFYHVDKKTNVFDYEDIQRQADKFKPKMIVSGGTAYPREINHKKMAEIARSVGAFYLADVAHEAGLIAAGVNSSPFKYASAVTMTTHKTLRGPRGGIAFVKKEFASMLDKSVFPGLQGGPHLHTIAGIAIALEKARSKEFAYYATQTIKNAQVLAEELVLSGFDIISGGTDKHLVLVDLRRKNNSGWFMAEALEVVGIVANRNTVPFDTGSPFYPSGLRLGTPALTVRGMKEPEMKMISEWIDKVCGVVGEQSVPGGQQDRKVRLSKFKKEIKDDKRLKEISKEVYALTKRFPVPGL